MTKQYSRALVCKAIDERLLHKCSKEKKGKTYFCVGSLHMVVAGTSILPA